MELVDRHHAEQNLIARNVVAELHPLWGILDFYNLRETTAPWLKAVRPVIERGYLTSQYVAAEFVKNLRAQTFPNADPLPIELPNPFGPFGIHQPPDRETQLKITMSMNFTGPSWLIQNTPPDVEEPQVRDLMERGFSKSSGAAIRHTLNGGRGMAVLLAQMDPLAMGVAGVADESSCGSCQFLTKPILKTDGIRKMQSVAVGHDFCRCSARVIYQQQQVIPFS